MESLDQAQDSHAESAEQLQLQMESHLCGACHVQGCKLNMRYTAGLTSC